MMAPEDVTIRPATTTDAEAIARVDIASWRGAYSEILSDSYLSSLDVGERAGRWNAAAAARDLMRTVLDGLTPGTVVTLWILEGNERAQHFYRRHGFQPDGTERIDDIGGRPLTQLRFRKR
jgi:ribosomal protein S18 acetylase RimI-like enzyme